MVPTYAGFQPKMLGFLPHPNLLRLDELLAVTYHSNE
jgi:hypothetical protein